MQLSRKILEVLWVGIPVALVALTLLSVLAGCQSNSSSRYPGTYVVTNDTGGYIADYLIKADDLQAQGRKVVIDGKCWSACIALLRNACATENASIGSHAPYFDGYKRRMTAAERKQEIDGSRMDHEYLLRELPPKVKRAFAYDSIPNVYRGASVNGLKLVTGKSAQALIGPC